MNNFLAPIQPDQNRTHVIIHKDNGEIETAWTAKLAHNDRIVSLCNDNTGKRYHTADALRADGVKRIEIEYHQEVTL